MSSKKRKKPEKQPRSDSYKESMMVIRQAVLDWDLEHAGRCLSQFMHDDFMVRGRMEGGEVLPLLREANHRFPDYAVSMHELDGYLDWLNRAVLVRRARERLEAWDAMDRALDKLLAENEAKNQAGELITPEDVAVIFGDAKEKLDRIRELP